MYKGNPKRLTADFLSETTEAKTLREDIFRELKEKECQPRILYPANLS